MSVIIRITRPVFVPLRRGKVARFKNFLAGFSRINQGRCGVLYYKTGFNTSTGREGASRTGYRATTGAPVHSFSRNLGFHLSMFTMLTGC